MCKVCIVAERECCARVLRHACSSAVNISRWLQKSRQNGERTQMHTQAVRKLQSKQTVLRTQRREHQPMPAEIDVQTVLRTQHCEHQPMPAGTQMTRLTTFMSAKRKVLYQCEVVAAACPAWTRTQQVNHCMPCPRTKMDQGTRLNVSRSATQIDTKTHTHPTSPAPHIADGTLLIEWACVHAHMRDLSTVYACGQHAGL